MRTPLLPRAPVLLVAIACSACTLITGASDLDSALFAAPAGDEGGAPESGPAPPAVDAADAPSPVEAAPPRGCPAGNTLFYCNDFDDPDLANGWDALDGTFGTLALATDGAVSGPHALSLDFPTSASGGTGRHLRKTVTGTWSKLTCSYSYRRDQIGNNQGLPVFLRILVETSLGELSIQQHVGLTANPTEVGFPGGRDPIEPPLAFEPGVFHRIGYEITRTAVRVFVDGQFTVMASHPVDSAPVRTQIAIGALHDGPNDAAWRVRFDDLMCVAIP